MAPPTGAFSPDKADDKLIGRTLSGKYVVQDRIGRGGFGAVYRAVQQPVGREVAIKVILPERASGPGDIVARFFREAKALGRLRARNAVTLYDYGEDDDGLLFMVQEFIDGRTLRSLLRAENRPLDPPRAIDIACQVLDALEEAHSLEIIHRDITPSNIMITVDAQGREVVKVLDFGLAKLRDPTSDEESLTRSGIAMGTPHYMAPEQILQREIDPRTDLYAMGILLYLMLMGRPPFRGKIAYEVLKQQIKATPPPMTGIPAVIEEVVRIALAKEPDQRFSSAAEMREALQLALSQADFTFDPLPMPRRTGEVALLPRRTGDGLPRGGFPRRTGEGLGSVNMPSDRYARTAAASPHAMGRMELDEAPVRQEGLSAAPTRDYTPLVDSLLESDIIQEVDSAQVMPEPLYDDYDPNYDERYDGSYVDEQGYERNYDGSYAGDSYVGESYAEGYGEYDEYEQYETLDPDRSLSDPVDMGPRPHARGGLAPVLFGLLFVAGVAAAAGYFLGIFK